MEQYDLYRGTPPHEQTPTSRAAAQEIREPSATLRARVLAHIEKTGVMGATDDEIERALNMRHQTASARRRELVLLGKVIDSHRVRKTRSGRNASVWVVCTVRG